MEPLGVRWTVGVDGISLFMVALTALLIPIGLLASANIERAKPFIVWMLLLEAGLIGVFLALDLILFFVFFEVVLVPMYFLIAGWGHDNRRYAAMKFFLFTMAGSAFLFVGILAVAFLHRSAEGFLTFDSQVLTDWASSSGALSSGTAKWLFMAFAVGFAVKVPLFPLHTWLPDAHTDAPTAGSVILAGVLLKMGTYGFLRFAVPMFPQAAVDLAPLLLVVAVIGIIYGAIVAAMQPNLKRLVAYSSVAHLGFVVLGTFALTQQSIQGGLFTMISHGLTTGALFLLARHALRASPHLRDRRTTRVSGRSIPVFGGLFVIAAFASIGLPGFSGFVGEFLALLGGFLTSRWYVVVATTGVILAAVYMLWAVQRTITGEPDEENSRMTRHLAAGDLHGRSVARPLALPRLLPEAGARPRAAERRAPRAPRRGSQRLQGARRQQRRPRGRRGRRRVIELGVARARRAGRRTIATPVDRLVRDRAAARVVRRRDPHRARTRAPAEARRGSAMPRSSIAFVGVLASGRVHVRAVAHRRPRRAVPGDRGHGRGRRLRGLRADGRAHRDAARAVPLVRLPRTREARRPGVLRADALLGHGHDADGVGQRPHHRVPRRSRSSRSRCTCWPRSTGAGSSRRKPVSSTSCWARSRPRSSSTASRSCTARRARRTSPKIAQFLATTTLLDDGVLLLGIALMLVGLGFKVAAAPFHMWTPDVYQGAPTPVTAFMAGATKAAAFGAILRVLLGAFELYRVDWRPAIWGLAVLSLLVGSIAALVQTDVKRMLAYSSIGHAGYILIGVQAATAEGTSAALFYLLAYALMVFGAFAIVTVVAPPRRRRTTRSSTYRGLAARATGARRPAHAVPARAGRCAAHGRVRREAVGVRRRRRRGPVLAGTHRHADRRDRRVRLPAHRVDDVRTGDTAEEPVPIRCRRATSESTRAPRSRSPSRPPV